MHTLLLDSCRVDDVYSTRRYGAGVLVGNAHPTTLPYLLCFPWINLNPEPGQALHDTDQSRNRMIWPRAAALLK